MENLFASNRSGSGNHRRFVMNICVEHNWYLNVGRKMKGLFQYSIFLAGGATTAVDACDIRNSSVDNEQPSDDDDLKLLNFANSSHVPHSHDSIDSPFQKSPICHITNVYWDIGDPTFICKHCGSTMWYQERKRKDRNTSNPEFTLCCMNGKVQLPLLKSALDILHNLHNNVDNRSKHFLRNIRAYNMMFSFTSFGGKVDTSINKGSNPPIFRIGGQNHHYIGGLIPLQNQKPKFAQLYIYDTKDEINNRLKCFRYVLTCKAAWRIFGFEIHYRYPPVQRLSFHLPQEKTVIFKDGDSIEDVLKKADAKKSMFEAWMGANKKYEEARNLTYSKFPTKFVYKEDKQEWT
ncbi:hypothetical protein QYF36_026957 [Acer negundo]|nr:hypothetical protein QYF36_026957 [Acer negundo]